MTKFLNISTDNTLGGNSPSDETVSSQKAIKSYVDGLKTDWYGTCSTAASTQAKVVSCTGFVLTTGVSIRVKFTNNQSYNGNPTLNVNGTGGISVKAYGTTNAARYYWRAGEVVAFTYDGTNWIMEDGATATTSYFGVTALTTSATSTSDTRAATPASINSLVLNMIEPYPVYSSSSTYAVGDKVRYSFNAWVCNTAITGKGEAWDASHWTKIDDIQTQIDSKQTTISDLSTIRSGAAAGATALQPNTAITGATKCKITYDSKGLVTAGADLNSSDITTALGYTPYNSTNPSGYITGITSSMVTTALGYTPYNSSNPNGYTSNVGTVTSVNNVQPVNGNVSISVGDTLPSQTGQSGKFLTTNGTSASWGSALTSNDVTSIYTATGTDPVNGVAVSNAIAPKQDTLVSGTNIKTINGNSVLGSGNIVIETSSTPSVDGTTISYNSNDSLQTIGVINKNGGTVLPIWQGTQLQWERGQQSTWYYWQTAVTSIWTQTTLPSSEYAWRTPGYGNNTFITIVENEYSSSNIILDSDKAAYSQDNGATWTAVILPSVLYWSNPIYDEVSGNFVVIGLRSSTSGSTNKAIYSTDSGASWNEVTLPVSGRWGELQKAGNKIYSLDYNGNKFIYTADGGYTWATCTLPTSGEWYMAYGNGTFVGLKYNSSTSIYSTDEGQTWTEVNAPSDMWNGWSGITYGNGVFVVTSLSTNKIMYSNDDGATWNTTTLTIFNAWTAPVYGGGTFMALAGGYAAYSRDGINWNISTMPVAKNFYAPVYGDGKFVVIEKLSYDLTNKAYFSTDGGVNWTETTLPATAHWVRPCYGNGRFVTNALESSTSSFLSITYGKCYTNTDTPTTSSTVYSAPETASTYTITSVTSGAITLSDNNTYYYNQSGNQYTYQSIGVAHPDWLCFINGVGVKIGTTTIATA